MESCKCGERLRSYRQEKNLSLRTAAESVDVTYSYLARIERGEVDYPSADLLIRLADLYDVDAERLMVQCGVLPPWLVCLLQHNEWTVDLIKYLRTHDEFPEIREPDDR